MWHHMYYKKQITAQFLNVNAKQGEAEVGGLRLSQCIYNCMTDYENLGDCLLNLQDEEIKELLGNNN